MTIVPKMTWLIPSIAVRNLSKLLLLGSRLEVTNLFQKQHMWCDGLMGTFRSHP